MKDKMPSHKMYCKDGSVHDVTSLKKHKALMKKGCGHKKKKGVDYKPANFKKSKPSKKALAALEKGAGSYDTRRYLGHKQKDSNAKK